jgi:hypothetical protein
LAWALGLALLLGAGCEALDSFNLSYLSDGSDNSECVLSASVDSVSRSAQALLTDLHLEAVVSKEGTAVRVSSRTPKGQRFALVIAPTSDGKTRVRIEWAGKPDETISGVSILAQLEYMSGS